MFRWALSPGGGAGFVVFAFGLPVLDFAFVAVRLSGCFFLLESAVDVAAFEEDGAAWPLCFALARWAFFCCNLACCCICNIIWYWSI